MSSPIVPTADQITESRNKLWHQNGDALLTVESLRAWLNQAGLVLFTPRSTQLPAPAPSVVEAVLGTATPDPTLEQVANARTMVRTLITEGSAVPLNLLGAGGPTAATSDTPDYVCSAAVFPYIFTMRGDKAWKQPPATIGAVRVSPLGLAAYELLASGGSRSAADLATELGKEVTEAAVLRGLTELWSQLRVIPVPQPDGVVLWELMSSRFTKQIKAGSNAGQPTALSALVSLYFGMAVVAKEEEIETFLSPLAPRSRIRDVVHALTGARQLETVAIDGRTQVHISGDLAHLDGTSAANTPSDESIEVAAAGDGPSEDSGAGRISKFVPKPRKTGTGFVQRFSPRPDGERQRRPFDKASAPGQRSAASRPGFRRPDTVGKPAGSSDRASSPRPSAKRDFTGKPFRAREGSERPAFGRTEQAGGPVRPFKRTPAAGGDADRPQGRKTFSKPGTFGRKRDDRESGAGSSGFDPAGSRRPFSKPGFPAKSARPPAGSSASRGAEREDYRSRSSASARDAGSRPKPYVSREQGSGPKRPFAPRGEGRAAGDQGADAPRKVFRKFDAPRGDRGASGRAGAPARPSGPRSSGAPREPGGFSDSKGSGRGPSKPLGTYAKFADGNKPFRPSRPGGRTFDAKPRGKSSDGPTGPRKRKPQDGENA